LPNVSSRTRVVGVIVALLTCIASILCVAQLSLADPYENTASLDDLSETRLAPSVFEEAGSLYVAGGVSDSSGSVSYDSTIVYDIVAGTSTRVASMVHGVGLAVNAEGADGLFYVFGGWNISLGGYTSITQVYSTANDTWWLGPSSPVQIGGGDAVALPDGRIIVVGSTSYTNSTMIYDTTSHTWSFGQDQPASIWLRQGAYVSSTAVYFMGGRLGSAVSQVDVYNPVDDSWTTVEPMLRASIWGGAFASTNGYVYYYGGVDGSWIGGSPTSDIMRYDPVADEWSYSPSGFWPGRMAFGEAVDESGRVFFAGGWDGGAVVDLVTMIVTADIEYDWLAITSPADGSIVSDEVTVTVTASNPYYGFMKLEVYIDGALAWEGTSLYAGSVSFLWDTSALTDRSSHTIRAVGYMYNGVVKADVATVTVWAGSAEEHIATLEQEIAVLQAQLAAADGNVTMILMTLAVLGQTFAELQAQLDDMQDQVDRIEDKADTASTYGMITMILVIIVIVLAALIIMMARRGGK